MQRYNHLAFVFPGQGSQSIGMLADLAGSFPEVRQVFSRASEVLRVDLWKVATEGPEDLLNRTENTQPIMLAAGVAVWEIWCSQTPIRPGWMAGHSLGEFTALVCAQSISFEEAIGLVRRRALLMQEAVPEKAGAMAAVMGLEDPAIVEICRKVSGPEGIVSPANFNAPGQVVIAGNASAVHAAIEAASAAGARRAIMLSVSVPSHCGLMQSAASKFSETLHGIDFEAPSVPVIHNFDVASHEESEVIRSVLVKQMYSPVRWVDSMKFLYDQGVTKIIECGPGKVLSGLIKRIVRECEAYPVFDPVTLDKAMENCE
ncbi:MAG: ACP S-malonyltransferase [Methylococcaceae bacterium]|nr:ACP S-malonyltransferase [Methylococcaceae bacterium]MCI0734125.1 ACP S-malonyltransferase [Methylococcaceae bacterium]